jgi:hypothetical protein
VEASRGYGGGRPGCKRKCLNELQFAMIGSNGLQYVNCTTDEVDGSAPPNWDGCDSWRQNIDFNGG